MRVINFSFKNKKFSLIVLAIILLLGLILRLWHLNSVPISPDWDEAALGYNAYSIMHTGRDEYGVFMPSVLRSFDDYKPALYAYLSIPFIALLGLTTFAVRLPSVVMGMLGILAAYFLAKELFRLKVLKNQKESSSGYTEYLALLAAFLMAISPWQIQFSRSAFETNTGLTFNLLIALFFLKGLRKPWFLSLSALLAGLNLAVYQSERVFTPLLLFALAIIYWKELFAVSKKYLAWAVVIGILVALPTLITIISNPVTLQRANGTSIISQKTPLLTVNYIRLMDDKNDNDVLGSVSDNRRVVFTKEIISGYLAHFNPNWLFLEGDNPRHHPPGMGDLYLLDLPFLLLGIYFFVFGKYERRTKLFIFSWLLLAPVPAAFTFGVPHAVRTMNMLFPLLMLISVGYFETFQILRKYQVPSFRFNKLIPGVYCLFLLVALFNFTYYLDQYFVQQNYFNAVDWQYGYAQAIPEIQNIQENYKQIVVSDKVPMDESYIFFLFYLKYPPQKYQQLVSAGRNVTPDDHTFGKYDFRLFNWGIEKNKKDVLYVGTVNDFPTNIVAKKTIPYPDGSPAILLVDPKDTSKL